MDYHSELVFMRGGYRMRGAMWVGSVGGKREQRISGGLEIRF